MKFTNLFLILISRKILVLKIVFFYKELETWVHDDYSANLRINISRMRLFWTLKANNYIGWKN